MARTGPAITRRKDRYQLRAASASQPKTLKTYACAREFRVDLVPLNVRDAGEIERSFAAFAPSSTDGLIVTSSPLAAIHRKQIVDLAARHNLPAVYYERYAVTAGDLFLMDRSSWINIVVRLATSTASSRAKSQPICRCKLRPSTNSPSISRPQRHLA